MELSIILNVRGYRASATQQIVKAYSIKQDTCISANNVVNDKQECNWYYARGGRIAGGGGRIAGGGGRIAGGPFATGLIAGGPFASGLNAATRVAKQRPGRSVKLTNSKKV